MPSSLGCRVSHSSIVTAETIAFININNEYSLLVLYIGKNTLIRRHVGHRPSWSTCHAQSYPGLPRSYRRPNLSHCKLFGRRNHHDIVEFRFLKKTYYTRNTATTREDWTALYHVISLKPTRPNQPAQVIYFGTEGVRLCTAMILCCMFSVLLLRFSYPMNQMRPECMSTIV